VLLDDDAATAGTTPISVATADAMISFFISQPLSHSAMVAERQWARVVPLNTSSAGVGPSLKGAADLR
jgi:hypothetical protein